MSALSHPRLVGLHRFWESKRGTRAMPSRGDFLPEEMLRFLGYVVLVDVEPGPLRFRFRLIGTEIVASYGVELTGCYTEAIEPLAYRAVVERHYALAVARAQPVAHHMSFNESTARIHDLARLIVPLSEDGRQVNMLMLASVFGPDLARFRERQREEHGPPANDRTA